MLSQRTILCMALLFILSRMASAACEDCTDSCVLLPPSGSSFPCYEGTPADANKCFLTDPLLPDGETFACGVCSNFGYDEYLRQDPIYVNMALWGTNSTSV